MYFACLNVFVCASACDVLCDVVWVVVCCLCVCVCFFVVQGVFVLCVGFIV